MRPSMIRPATRPTAVRCITIGLLTLGVLAGCVGYTTYDPAVGPIDLQSPNQPALEEIMVAGLGWTIEHFPPGTPPDLGTIGQTALDRGDRAVAISLPSGLSQAQYDRIVTRADANAAAWDASPGLPIYRVGRIWIRGSKATIDIHRPLTDGATTAEQYQTITIEMRSGYGGWHYDRFRAWEPGVGALPPLTAIKDPPDQDDSDQADPGGAETDPADSGR